ncbi:MAG: hypothetical protein AABZ55_02480, partial [Bdellovibrionota bacterium]
MSEKRQTSNEFDLINLEDFKSFKVEIVVRNDSNGSRISSFKNEVELCELKTQGWCMQVPAGFCKRGRQYKVNLELDSPHKKIKVKSTVDVKKIV